MATGRLSGKVALVTGAASGIGGACARRFAAEGAAVAGADVNPASDPAWQAVAETAPDHAFYSVDVRDEAAVEALVGKAVERFGHIDVLLNAAGVASAGAVDAVDEAEWDRVLDINLKGTFLVCKHVARHMAGRGGPGSIINIASVEGLEGFQGQAAYNASKGGVVLLTRNMAVDYGLQNIRVNCLCPGLIETPMTAPMVDVPELKPLLDTFLSYHLLGRAGQPDEVASAALFLASDDASFITGHALAVDGGFTAGRRLLPGGATLGG
ncbi:MAG: SDR family oxidoreductase [Proteobacteria bacterium]|nr:SDR family oxidoreductase [Pseudomonadota bacterium]